MIGMFILAILIMAIGMLGTLAPVLPGIPIIFLSMLGYGWYEHFQNITPGFLMIMGALTMLSLLADYISTYWGVKLFGATRISMYAAVIGGIFGIFVLPPLGIVLWPIVFATVAEFHQRRDFTAAVKSGIGALVGLVTSMVFKVILGSLMILAFILKNIF